MNWLQNCPTEFCILEETQLANLYVSDSEILPPAWMVSKKKKDVSLWNTAIPLRAEAISKKKKKDFFTS